MERLDMYDDMPSGMKAYLRNYGFHFNKKACEFAVSKMRKHNAASGMMEKMEFLSKDAVEEALRKYGVAIDGATLYDHVYVYHMAKADYYQSSLSDEMHLALYVKDTIDDVDACDGQIFNRWYADMVHSGQPIEWDDLI